MAGRAARAEKSADTRQTILDAAERLFAAHGVHAVSTRKISEEAGQGNNAAVSYHFGGKTDLIRAIVRTHAERIEEIRARLVAEAAGSDDVRTWLSCLVRPFTDHLDALGPPTWYARFRIQVTADPGLREISQDEALASPSLRLLIAHLTHTLPGPPPEVRAERLNMASHLILSMCVEREHALAEGTAARQLTWNDLADNLTDALVGLWQAHSTG
ncbi:TetR/AcrR family transcriptional regulator [Streptomyces desertarenae]|uniref:TetR/AcrR family transcriptional regulator n=1 Tax=Streptomyces desertarenae TaxID=2666184 RepID=A0ABW4PHZ2_9ACTN